MTAADNIPVDQKPPLLKPIEEMDFFSRKVEILRSNGTRSADTETINDDDGIGSTKVDLSLNTGLHLRTFDSGTAAEIKHDNQLSTLRLKLDCLNEENKKLKSMLDQITKNYRALQTQILLAMQQQQLRNNGQEQKDQRTAGMPSSTTLCARQFMDPSPSGALDINEPSRSEDETQRPPVSSTPISSSNNIKVMSKTYGDQDDDHDQNQIARKRPSLQFQAASDDQSSQSWGANKSAKLLTQPKTTEQAPDEIVPCRKARVSIRARSDAPLMSDGCQWRKYGQKMAKGNPCPRAYYRCTMAVGCPVRKQVQRCAEDKTILITTYEGNHNHPLPPAAIVMANTTSAAASMLLSGSTMSNKETPTHNTAATLFPPWTYTSSMATLSASAPFPTITLDLTHPPNTLQFQPSGPSPSTLFPLPFHSTIPFQLMQAMQMHSSSTTTPKLPLIPAALQQLAGQRHYSSMVETITSALATDPNLAAALASALSSIMGTASQSTNEANSTSNNSGVDPTVAPPALAQLPLSMQPTRVTMPTP